MAEYDSTIDGQDEKSDEGDNKSSISCNFLEYLVKRFVLLVSFGPGVIGLLWLIGRLIRRKK